MLFRSRIISGSSDNTVRIWDADTQQQIGDPLKGQIGDVDYVPVSPDARESISGGHGKTETQQEMGESLDSQGGWNLWHDSSCPTVLHLTFTDHSLFPAPRPHNHPIHILQPNTPYFSPQLTLQPDGWLVGPHQELLLWIPHHLVPQLPRSFLLGILGGHEMIRFDPATPFYMGEEWTRFKTG